MGLFLALLVVEGALRVIPNRWQAGARLFTFDPQIGILPTPSHTFNYSMNCIYTEGVHINSFGFRDRERKLTKNGLRVALFGDSMVNGLEVSDLEVVNRVLEQKFHSIEFLNFWEIRV
jgi:hypothetical protein